jgi:hypothetical protein
LCHNILHVASAIRRTRGSDLRLLRLILPLLWHLWLLMLMLLLLLLTSATEQRRDGRV